METPYSVLTVTEEESILQDAPKDLVLSFQEKSGSRTLTRLVFSMRPGRTLQNDLDGLKVNLGALQPYRSDRSHKYAS